MVSLFKGFLFPLMEAAERAADDMGNTLVNSTYSRASMGFSYETKDGENKNQRARSLVLLSSKTDQSMKHIPHRVKTCVDIRKLFTLAFGSDLTFK